ncbi:Trafficking protein particle complex subunit 33 [Cladochytrium tenue]|nr:Trafficking protein particle complex subunit 33 [Cladochytrium tenue]
MSAALPPAASTAPAGAANAVAESCFDLLMMEIVDLMHRPAAAAAAAAAATRPGATALSEDASSPSAAATATDATASDKEAAYFKLETLGYRVGMAIAERATRDRPRFADNLEIVKFICKDFWISVFRKQVDNLKTNHRGVYVLTDNNFRWFARMSADGPASETSKLAGALANLGIVSVVIAEVSNIPQCTFQIKFRL